MFLAQPKLPRPWVLGWIGHELSYPFRGLLAGDVLGSSENIGSDSAYFGFPKHAVPFPSYYSCCRLNLSLGNALLAGRYHHTLSCKCCPLVTAIVNRDSFLHFIMLYDEKDSTML